MASSNNHHQGTHFVITITLSCKISHNIEEQHTITKCVHHDSSLAAAVAMAPSDSRFDPRQRRHLIRAQLVSQLIRVQLVLLD